MTFQLDTSGKVATPDGFWTAWPDLSPFTQGYIEALFATAVECGNVGHMSKAAAPFVKVSGFSDLAPETLARIIADCEAREAGWKAANAAVRADDATEGGRFWRDRQSGAATSFPSLTVQLGDDGKVRFA